MVAYIPALCAEHDARVSNVCHLFIIVDGVLKHAQDSQLIYGH
jgi:hypothetical protein